MSSCFFIKSLLSKLRTLDLEYFFLFQQTHIGTCNYTAIRLYNNAKKTVVSDEGTLQICSSTNNWTAVCDYNWRCDHARVACKQLGFSNTSKINLIVLSLDISI